MRFWTADTAYRMHRVLAVRGVAPSKKATINLAKLCQQPFQCVPTFSLFSYDSSRPPLPAEAYLLVQSQHPLQGPTEPVLKPALAAEHR